MISVIVDRLRLFTLRELAARWGRQVAALTVVSVASALLVAVIGIAASVPASASRLASGIGGRAQLEISGVTDSGFDQRLQSSVAGVAGSRPRCRCCGSSSGRAAISFCCWVSI
ncbi:hypothetical protein ACIRRA_05775 [Nocardia sp. NPDC101769]|uniref:hypothetical protein n=1 Tax=Nocardia sp. NPDC101769 TaxID=3364333 RepID=UPI0037F9A288